MASISLTQQAREVESGIREILSSFDVDSLPLHERELVMLIKRQANEARLDVRDYEYADTRQERLGIIEEATKRYEGLQKDILKASEQNLFSSLDVVQISAGIQHIISQMD